MPRWSFLGIGSIVLISACFCEQLAARLNRMFPNVRDLIAAGRIGDDKSKADLFYGLVRQDF